jgi:hypothetical protein
MDDFSNCSVFFKRLRGKRFTDGIGFAQTNHDLRQGSKIGSLGQMV